MIPKQVYEAFRLQGEGVPLSGGQNNSYRFKDIILKKNDGDNQNIHLIASILDSLHSPHYRVTKHILSKNGNYVEDGYIAACYEQGDHDFNRTSDVIELSKIFHRDIAHFDIDSMNVVNTQWAMAADILFRQKEIPDYANCNHLKICLNMIEQLPHHNDKLQIIHGDMGGNVLFHHTLPPCIIDFSPLIAPAKMAEAIAVCDYAAWVSKDAKSIELINLDEYRDYILYAVMFRILTMLCKRDCSDGEFESEYNAYIKVWNYVQDKCKL